MQLIVINANRRYTPTEAQLKAANYIEAWPTVKKAESCNPTTDAFTIVDGAVSINPNCLPEDSNYRSTATTNTTPENTTP